MRRLLAVVNAGALLAARCGANGGSETRRALKVDLVRLTGAMNKAATQDLRVMEV